MPRTIRRKRSRDFISGSLKIDIDELSGIEYADSEDNEHKGYNGDYPNPKPAVAQEADFRGILHDNLGSEERDNGKQEEDETGVRDRNGLAGGESEDTPHYPTGVLEGRKAEENPGEVYD